MTTFFLQNNQEAPKSVPSLTTHFSPLKGAHLWLEIHEVTLRKMGDNCTGLCLCSLLSCLPLQRNNGGDNRAETNFLFAVVSITKAHGCLAWGSSGRGNLHKPPTHFLAPLFQPAALYVRHKPGVGGLNGTFRGSDKGGRGLEWRLGGRVRVWFWDAWDRWGGGCRSWDSG